MNINWDIVDEILGEISFFADRYDRYTVYAEYQKQKDCLEFYPVDSEEFESCMRVWYRNRAQKRKAPNVREIIQYIRDEATYYEDLEAVEPHARVAGNLRDGIEYFLADRLRNVVKVTGDGWKISDKTVHKFLSTRSFGTQVCPVQSRETLVDLLAPLVNLTGDNLLLFAIWLTQAFSCGSHYGVMLSAERGSGKSSLTRMIGKLIDPSDGDPPIMQSKLSDLQNYLANHYLACFDNVRDIPTDFSDTFCAAITGSTVAKRQLFKDRDEVRMKLHNIVVMNGIGIFPKESDLAERFLLFELKKIKSAGAKSDYELRHLFEQKRPLILGSIFDLLVEASSIIKVLRPKAPTRMTDAYTEMLAIAMAMGLSEQEFHSMIIQNVERLNRAAISPVVQAVSEYMSGPMACKRKTVESSTEFFDHVRKNFSGKKELLGGRAAEFSKTLKAEIPALQKAGFGCLVDDTGAKGSVITVIRDKY